MGSLITFTGALSRTLVTQRAPLSLSAVRIATIGDKLPLEPLEIIPLAVPLSLTLGLFALFRTRIS
jgi:hypothetical protein